MLHHGIEEGTSSHAGGLLGLPRITQPLLKRLEDRIVPHYHVQEAHIPTPAPSLPLAAPSSTVTVPRHRGHTHEGCNLLTVQRSQFGYVRQQRQEITGPTPGTDSV